MNNPRYQIVLESANNNNYLLIILKGPKQYQIGFDINTIVLNDVNAVTAFKTKNSGPFRSVLYLDCSSNINDIVLIYFIFIFIFTDQDLYIWNWKMYPQDHIILFLQHMYLVKRDHSF